MEGTSKGGTGQKGPQNMSFPHKPQITPPQTMLAVAEELRDTKGRWGSHGPAAGKAERGCTAQWHGIWEAFGDSTALTPCL